MTLNVNLLLCRLSYAYCDQAAEARITRFFRYKVKLALYLSHLHIKFDDEIPRESYRISSTISD